MRSRVESLKELSQICQKPKYKEIGNWMVRHILRDAALPVTWLLLHTSITANQVTLISLVVGLIGIACFAFVSKVGFLIGTLLLQTWYFLDHVDGQIARYRKTASLSGRFFDFITHHIIHGTVFFSLGLYLYFIGGGIYFVVWGFITSIAIAVFNLINDTKYKTFFEKLVGIKEIRIQSKAESAGAKPTKDIHAIPRTIFSLIHKLSEIHVLMNILTLAAFLEFIFRLPFDLRILLFIFYGLAVPLLTTVKLIYLITQKKIDTEFETIFQNMERP